MKQEGKNSWRWKMKFRGSYFKWLFLSAALLASLGFAACGGTSGVAGGGIGGTGKAIGAIAAVDSGTATVNGVQFATSAAVVTIDDSPGSESDLRPGMVVAIEGDFNDDGATGTAVTVSSNDVVEGPVTSAVNTTNRSFEVMGQVVFYTATTVFEISGGGNLAPTDLTSTSAMKTAMTTATAVSSAASATAVAQNPPPSPSSALKTVSPTPPKNASTAGTVRMYLCPLGILLVFAIGVLTLSIVLPRIQERRQASDAFLNDPAFSSVDSLMDEKASSPVFSPLSRATSAHEGESGSRATTRSLTRNSHRRRPRSQAPLAGQGKGSTKRRATAKRSMEGEAE